jgi:hypothetical protein
MSRGRMPAEAGYGLPYALLVVATVAPWGASWASGQTVGAEFSAGPGGGSRAGSTYSLSCGNDAVLVGISGTAGFWIDRVTAHCRRVTNDGRWDGSPFPAGSAGGPGGTSAFSLQCPTNFAVTDIRGQAGSHVNRLQIGCRRLTGDGRTQGDAQIVNANGLRGGSMSAAAFGWDTCNQFVPGKRLIGHNGQYVNRVELRCARVPVRILNAPNLLSPAPNEQAPSHGRPAFRWSSILGATRYELCATRQNGPQCDLLNLQRPGSDTIYVPRLGLQFDNRPVFWTVRACSSRGCGPWAQTRWLAPPQFNFAQLLAPTFKHPRCVNCHSVVASGGFPFNSAHPQTPVTGDCTGCHRYLPPAQLSQITWHGAPSPMDFRGKSDSQLCHMARNRGSVAISPLQHLTQDPLVLWAVGDGRVPVVNNPSSFNTLPLAPPHNITTWRSLVQQWISEGMPCP